MNAHEREKLTSFLQQLTQAQVGAKDSEAVTLIQEACNRQPDAYYLLIQRSLLLDQALENAQAEIARLKKEQQESLRGSASSFLDNNAWGSAPVQTAAAPRASAYAQAAAPVASPAPASSSFLNSGLLGTVASTAVGVVAGSFLFNGIEKMMGSHDGKSGLLSENAPAPTKAPTENVVADSHSDLVSSNVDDLDSLDLPEGESDWV